MDTKKEEHWCFVCGKKLTTKPRYWVHITNGNEFVPPDYDGEDSQGCFPVGNGCAKLPHIKPHVFK